MLTKGWRALCPLVVELSFANRLQHSSTLCVSGASSTRTHQAKGKRPKIIQQECRFFSSTFSSSSSSSSVPVSIPTKTIDPPLPLQEPTPAPSYFRRPLPEHLISFTSEEGRQVFREALADKYMESFFPLSQQYTTQQEPAYCGLTSLTMCLNALDIDPQRNWKGPWRYFAEELLDCCTPIELVKRRGITFAEFACLAQCNGAAVKMYRADCSSLEEFRSLILEATSRPSPNSRQEELMIKRETESEEGPLMVVSYARNVLGQTGVGHFSPIGGYNPGRDLALVMDTARFKYSSHWVPVSLLWESMKNPDVSTGRSRGYFILRRLQMSPLPSEKPECNSKKKKKNDTPKQKVPRSICELDMSSDAWTRVVHHFCTVLPTTLKSNPPSQVSDVIRLLIDLLPQEVNLIRMSDAASLVPSSLPSPSSSTSLSGVAGCSSPICRTTSVCQSTISQTNADNSSILTEGNKSLTQHLEATAMYQLIRSSWPPKDWPSGEASDSSLAVATLLVLAYPSKAYASTLDLSLREALAELRNLDQFPPPLQAEILQIREQMFHLNHRCQLCNADAACLSI